MKFRAKPKDQEIVEAVQLTYPLRIARNPSTAISVPWDGRVSAYPTEDKLAFSKGIGAFKGEHWVPEGSWVVRDGDTTRFISDPDFRAAYEPLEGVDTSAVPMTVCRSVENGCACQKCRDFRVKFSIPPIPEVPLKVEWNDQTGRVDKPPPPEKKCADCGLPIRECLRKIREALERTERDRIKFSGWINHDRGGWCATKEFNPPADSTPWCPTCERPGEERKTCPKRPGPIAW